jgi:hypothetical protein
MHEVSSDRERETSREHPSPLHIRFASSRTSSIGVTGRTLVAVLAICAVTVFAFVAVAAAAEPNTWGPVTALPTGSTPASDQIYSTPTGGLMRYSRQSGTPSVAFFGAEGQLGAEQLVDGATSESQLGSVAFLPDGAAVISYTYNGALDLVVREPNGAYGARFGSPHGAIVAFAAREGEVMIATEDTGTTNFKPQIKVSSLTVEAGGFLTETGTPTSVYELPASDTSVAVIGSVALALDANGQADLVMRTEGNAGNEVLDFARSSTGAWSGPSSLSAGLYEAEHASGMQVAVAPGGRALLAFQTENFPARYSNVADTAEVYESLREPGGTFSTPTSVASASGVGGASATTRVAAGADGTLALATRTEACQSENHTEVVAEALSALIAAPGKAIVPFAVSAPDTADAASYLESLGAGDGQALVGLENKTVTAGQGENLCGEYGPNPPGQASTFSDRAVLLGQETSTVEKTFGSSSGEMKIYAAGIDLGGDAAVTGSLATHEGAEYDFYTGPLGTEKSVPKEVPKEGTTEEAPSSKSESTETPTAKKEEPAPITIINNFPAGPSPPATSTGTTAPASTGTPAASTPPPVAVKKPLTTAQKLAGAIKTCQKLKSPKRASCIAAAKKRYRPSKAKPKKKKVK